MKAKTLIAQIDQTVRDLGEHLEGNICYHHHLSGSREWTKELAQKRRAWQTVINTVTNCVEIGVNAGHSAVLALSANPALRYWGIDPCSHSYTLPCWQLIRAEYGDRAQLIQGHSPEALDHLPPQRGRGLWSIDGDHSQLGASRDIARVTELARPGDLLWIDDVDAKTVRRAVKQSIDHRWRKINSSEPTVAMYQRLSTRQGQSN